MNVTRAIMSAQGAAGLGPQVCHDRPCEGRMTRREGAWGCQPRACPAARPRREPGVRERQQWFNGWGGGGGGEGGRTLGSKVLEEHPPSGAHGRRVWRASWPRGRGRGRFPVKGELPSGGLTGYQGPLDQPGRWRCSDLKLEQSLAGPRAGR